MALDNSAAGAARSDESALSADTVAWMLRLSDKLRRFVDFVGKWGSLLIIPLVLITIWDICGRFNGKLQYWLVQNYGWIFNSTLLQELEWHFHTALFALVLGYGYIQNVHVRIDLVRDHLAFRKKAWLEFLGCTLFMIPFCLIVIYFASYNVYESYQLHEGSPSTVGLSNYWIIKSVLVFGLVVAVFAGVAVWLQTVILLWGPKDIRFPLMTLEWPEEAGSKIEGKERIKLEEATDTLAPPPLQ
ncbi:MAG: TRAP transporter small permease subunit [Gammaproteobacteria bacterium]